MPRLAGFGDEIAKDIATQLEVMVSEGVRALELRAAEGIGVLDLCGEVRETVRAKLRAAGIEVFSIGSPLGKVPIEAPAEAELERTRIAIEQAHFFGASRIRIFSFFIPDRRYDEFRGAVMDRLGVMAELAEQSGVVLCHENEARIYGEPMANCVDLLSTINSPALRVVHDTANFLHAGEEPFPAAYDAVKPYLDYCHIKDRCGSEHRAAGEGDGRMPELFAALRADGYEGYLSLEPHLGGGPDKFRSAAQALKRCLDELGWAYE